MSFFVMAFFISCFFNMGYFCMVVQGANMRRNLILELEEAYAAIDKMRRQNELLMSAASCQYRQIQTQQGTIALLTAGNPALGCGEETRQ